LTLEEAQDFYEDDEPDEEIERIWQASYPSTSRQSAR
jgi:hypothetical protein